MHIQHASELRERMKFQGKFLRDSCVVDQADEGDLVRGELGKKLLCAGFDGGGFGHVHDDGAEGGNAEGLDGCSIRRFTHGAVDDEALFGQVLCGVIADASAGAGDDDGSAFDGDGKALPENEKDEPIEEEG